MQTYVLLARLEQLCHSLLGQPDGFILKSDIDFHQAIFSLVNEKVALLRKVEHKLRFKI